MLSALAPAPTKVPGEARARVFDEWVNDLMNSFYEMEHSFSNVLLNHMDIELIKILTLETLQVYYAFAK